ncbi:hypothetical protein D3C72_1281600 [compost metagenome]
MSAETSTGLFGPWIVSMNGMCDSPPTKRYGSWSPNCLTSDRPRPIKRLTDSTVFKGSVAAASLADSPTSTRSAW